MSQPSKPKSQRQRLPVLYPFLFGPYSILALLSTNAGKIYLQDIVRSIVVILTALVGLFGLLWLLFRSRERAGLTVLLNTFLFFSYGHIYALICSLPGLQDFPADVFLAIWAAVAILGIWWILRKTQMPWRYTRILNIFTIILLLMPGANIAFRALQNQNSRNAIDVSRSQSVGIDVQIAGHNNADSPTTAYAAAAAEKSPLSKHPDVYYLILDGYARQDVLQDLYRYDNSAFIQALRDRGFYVAPQSHSNYSNTLLSLSSSLNANYLDFSELGPNTDPSSDVGLIRLIEHSYVRSFFEEMGYQTVAFNNNYSIRSPDAAGLVISNGGLNNFEHQLVDTTLVMLAGYQLYADAARLAVHTSLEQAPTLRDPGTPRFIFVHIISPHPPFLFGPNGEKLPFQGYTGDGSTFYGGSQKYASLYTGQLTYLNRLVLQTVDLLLADPDNQPVVIIQGDHGPAAYLDAPDGPCVRERMSILNAYYLPEQKSAPLYPNITPVNTFRLLFDTYFGTNLGLLEDRTYLSPSGSPFHPDDVTNRLDECKNQPSQTP